MPSSRSDAGLGRGTMAVRGFIGAAAAGGFLCVGVMGAAGGACAPADATATASSAATVRLMNLNVDLRENAARASVGATGDGGVEPPPDPWIFAGTEYSGHARSPLPAPVAGSAALVAQPPRHSAGAAIL